MIGGEAEPFFSIDLHRPLGLYRGTSNASTGPRWTGNSSILAVSGGRIEPFP